MVDQCCEATLQMLAKPSFFIRFASRASIRWLRNIDRPPRRSLSNELLIARGTPPNLEIDPERPFFENSVSETKSLRSQNSPKRAFPDRSLGGEFLLQAPHKWPISSAGFSRRSLLNGFSEMFGRNAKNGGDQLFGIDRF